MRVKLEWLNELVDLSNLTTEEIVNKISLYSIEVEGVERVARGSNLVIGHVLTKTPHPDSNHLNILTVDVKTEVLQIVCGAPNVEVGQYVIIALVGAVLPGDFKIKKSKIRNVESSGMVCSLQEIGVDKKYIPSKYEHGIYYFEDEVEVGTDALKALNFSDEVLELGLTPNRGDMLSMLGVAIEMSAVFSRPLKPLAYKMIYDNEQTSKYLTIENKTDKCLSYYGTLIKNVEIKESPRWLRSRLVAFGIRSINNVVDITNYILALFGQPLHAFDADKLGNKIVIRNAYANEVMKTLDDQERKLLESDVVITDGENPVALAGVMGGLETEVTAETKNIVLEAAVFDSMTVRSTTSRLNLHSESSMRYERGVDVNTTSLALDYACYLLKELAGATVLSTPVHQGIKELKPVVIEVSAKYISNLLGTTISQDKVSSILKSLGFEVEEQKDQLKVTVPTRRGDITMKADLVEEVGRLFGYDKLQLTLPVDDMAGSLTNKQLRRRKLRHALINLGLQEIISYSLVKTKDNETFTCNHKENSEAVKLMKPMTEDHAEVRRSLMPSMLEVVKYNIARKVKDILAFEIGSVYYLEGEESHEDETLAICLTGTYSDVLWNGVKEKVDFFLLKGLLNKALQTLDVEVEYSPLETVSELHPKRSASISYKGKTIGYIGELHPKYSKENDLEETYVLEICLEDILSYEKPTIRYKQASKMPIVERDVAIVFNKDILAGKIINTIKRNGGHDLLDVKVFDLYTGDKISSNQKSMAIHLSFLSEETLTDDVINNRINKILKALDKEYQATLRN